MYAKGILAATIGLTVLVIASLASGQEIATVAVPEPTDEAIRYYRSGNILWFGQIAWSVLVPALFLFTGFSARIGNWVTVTVSPRWFRCIGLI